MPGWVMDTEDLHRLERRLQELKPDLAVECGSGASTRILRTYAKRAISLEHSGTWAADTEKYCQGAPPGQLIIAGIVNIITPVGKLPFYDTPLPDGIDFALIDGPPGSIGRAGTFHALHPHLTDNAVVWLDDIQRQEERDILGTWRDQYSVIVEKLSPRIAEIRMC